MSLKLFKFLTDKLDVGSEVAYRIVMLLKPFAPKRVTTGREYRIVEQFHYIPFFINGHAKWLCRAKRREQSVFMYRYRKHEWIARAWVEE